MAQRRMFAQSIVLSDAFLDMPLSARCLYFTLGMLADDDGFVGNPKSVMRQCGASQDDMAVLLQKRYVLGFETGVIVIKHWRMNNYLQSDRKKNTTYVEEMSTLMIDEKGAYTERDKGVYTECIQNGYIGKDSIGKDSIEIVLYLNEKSGKNFRYSSRKTKDLIQARLNEGFSIDDFKTVIDKKCAEWKGDSKMDQYLRPETLFGTKFESYLNQQAVTPKKGIANFDQREQDWDKLDELFNQ